MTRLAFGLDRQRLASVSDDKTAYLRQAAEWMANASMGLASGLPGFVGISTFAD